MEGRREFAIERLAVPELIDGPAKVVVLEDSVGTNWWIPADDRQIDAHSRVNSNRMRVKSQGAVGGAGKGCEWCQVVTMVRVLVKIQARAL